MRKFVRPNAWILLFEKIGKGMSNGILLCRCNLKDRVWACCRYRLVLILEDCSRRMDEPSKRQRDVHCRAHSSVAVVVHDSDSRTSIQTCIQTCVSKLVYPNLFPNLPKPDLFGVRRDLCWSDPCGMLWIFHCNCSQAASSSSSLMTPLGTTNNVWTINYSVPSGLCGDPAHSYSWRFFSHCKFGFEKSARSILRLIRSQSKFLFGNELDRLPSVTSIFRVSFGK